MPASLGIRGRAKSLQKIAGGGIKKKYGVPSSPPFPLMSRAKQMSPIMSCGRIMTATRRAHDTRKRGEERGGGQSAVCTCFLLRSRPRYGSKPEQSFGKNSGEVRRTLSMMLYCLLVLLGICCQDGKTNTCSSWGNDDRSCLVCSVLMGFTVVACELSVSRCSVIVFRERRDASM